VITTCSPRNSDLVKSLGAAAAFDYKDPDCASQIKQFAHNNLKLVWDCIALEPSAKICAEAIAAGGVYASLLDVKLPRDDVEVKTTLGYTCVGEPVVKPWVQLPDNSADFEFMKKFIKVAEPLLEAGKLKVHPPKVGKGLENVFQGLDLLRHDKVSGQKLVYTL